MDYSISRLQGSKAAKKAKSKKKNNKKPIKVVYISNPMKVKTSPSKFRALVQELTGQDAELADPTKFTDTDDDVGNQTVPDAAKNSIDDHAQEFPRVGEQPTGHRHHEQQHSTMAYDQDVPFETFDEVFTPYMQENFTGFLPPGLFL
ncbi:sigma factor binding protein 1, chloroplastic-like [Durio zibethinus]|uniref:Sigma factor binding protein 1, chloroplastic-like n=1 Tax=Durio zibethinus TaxID=66656 RepID=A0A6P5Z3A4_DURZI|nr:sigma factor binding protein 1, chloroplastic-like [Durio zibethinus]